MHPEIMRTVACERVLDLRRQAAAARLATASRQHRLARWHRGGSAVR